MKRYGLAANHAVCGYGLWFRQPRNVFLAAGSVEVKFKKWQHRKR